MKEIFEKVDNIAIKHIMICDDMMKYSQSFGFNGFKRMFRHLAKKAMCWHVSLENDAFDYHKLLLETKVDYTPTTPVSLKMILETYRTILKEDIVILGSLNKQYYEIVGVDNINIHKMIECILEKYNKVSRHISRFNESNWNSMELHIVDDKLHTKMKEVENNERY